MEQYLTDEDECGYCAGTGHDVHTESLRLLECRHCNGTCLAPRAPTMADLPPTGANRAHEPDDWDLPLETFRPLFLLILGCAIAALCGLIAWVKYHG